ncbi:hypothetical protein D3C78_1469950 [compost metagenome]
MGVGIAVPVCFIGAHRVFVPFAGKDALPANRLKTMTYATDARKQIDKAERIIRMNSRWAWKQILQESKLPLAQSMACPLARNQPLEDRRAPVALALCIQLVDQRFGVIDGQQLAQ